MANQVLEMKELGLQVRFLRTGKESNGEVLEMEVTGRPRGFLSQRHVHGAQAERLEVVSGVMKVVMNGRTHVLNPGQSVEVPAGTPHTQVPVGDGPGCVRIQVRPAGRTQAFLERLAVLSREGKITRSGFPRPVAGAQLVLDYADTGHAAKPSLRVQRAVARLVMSLAHPMRRTCSSTNGMWRRRLRPCSRRWPTVARIRDGGGRSIWKSSQPGRSKSGRSRGSTSRGGSRTTSAPAR